MQYLRFLAHANCELNTVHACLAELPMDCMHAGCSRGEKVLAMLREGAEKEREAVQWNMPDPRPVLAAVELHS